MDPSPGRSREFVLRRMACHLDEVVDGRSLSWKEGVYITRPPIGLQRRRRRAKYSRMVRRVRREATSCGECWDSGPWNSSSSPEKHWVPKDL